MIDTREQFLGKELLGEGGGGGGGGGEGEVLVFITFSDSFSFFCLRVLKKYLNQSVENAGVAFVKGANKKMSPLKRLKNSNT